MVLKGFFKFVSIRLTKCHQEKKCIRGNNTPFFNKELSSTNKERTQLEIRYLKKRYIKKKSFILNNEIFVFLYYEKLKKVLCQSKSHRHS